VTGPDAVLPEPKEIAQRPGFAIGAPVESSRKPRNFPVNVLNAAISPLAVFATSMALEAGRRGRFPRAR
jgi:hypothetical protein